MFCTNNPSPPLNAIPPRPLDPAQAQHRAENLAACLEMRDLGLQLARAAAARAMAAHEQALAAAPVVEIPVAETPVAETPGAPPTAKPADPDLAFARHSRSVRQSVELWEKIISNAFARRPQSPNPDWPETSDFDPDPDLDDPYTPPAYSELDRGNLYEAVANLALIHPDHAEIPETLHAVIAETLTAHPDDHLSVNFARVCQAFDIPPDRFRLKPHLESQLRPQQEGWPKLE